MVSRKFPPTTGGTQTVLKNLFAFFDDNEYLVVHDDERTTERIEFAYRESRVDFPYIMRGVLGRLLIPLYVLLIPAIVARLLVLHKREHFTKCLILYPDPFFSVAGYLFTRLAGVEYVLYFHDLFEEAQVKWTRILQRALAKIFEKKMIQGSQHFLVICGGLRDFYRDKYGSDPLVLPHSLDLAIVPKESRLMNADKALGVPSKAIRVMYSGGVYDNQYDAVLAFVEAIRDSPIDIKLTITSKRSRGYFEKIGIADENTEVSFLRDRKDVFEAQRQADILYLPLAFKSRNPLEVRTALPTKILEYVASMRPILVHCRAYSFLSRFCIENKIGFVCNTTDKEAIVNAINILTDPAYKIDYKYRVEWLAKYDRRKIAKEFRHILGGKGVE